MSAVRPVLAVGDRVRFDGDEHQVVGLAGTNVRLRAAAGEQVVLAGHLMSAPDFAVLGSIGLSAVEPFGLLEALPADVVAEAGSWRDHLVEVETGLPHGAAPGTMAREGYDPQTTPLADRQRVKAAALGVSFRTIEGKRARYAAQGLWALVDQRAARTFEVAGQADARLVASRRRAGDHVRRVRRGRRSRKMAMTTQLGTTQLGTTQFGTTRLSSPAGYDLLPDELVPDEPVTTKEGWRRFVENQPEPPAILRAEALADLPPRKRAELLQARKDYHSDLPLAATPIMRQLMATGRLLIQLNRGQISARRGIILSGASGTGKTTALTQLGRTHERAVRRRHGTAGDARIRSPT